MATKIPEMNRESRQLQSVVQAEGLIELCWSDGSRNRFYPIWLRDACRWEDGHESRYPSNGLSDNAYDDADRRARAFCPRPWDDALRQDPPGLSYSEIQDDDSGLLQLLHSVRDHGICFLHSAPVCRWF